MKKDLKRQIITALAVTAVLGAAGGMTAQATDTKHILASQDTINDDSALGGKSYWYGVVGGNAYADAGLKDTAGKIGTTVNALAENGLLNLFPSVQGTVDGIKGKVDEVNRVLVNTTSVENTDPVVLTGNAGVKLTATNDNPSVLRYYGVVGGDLSVNTGLSGTMEVNFNEMLKTDSLNVEAGSQEMNIVRKGDVENSIAGGSVIGGVGGSAAAALGKVNVTLGTEEDPYSYKISNPFPGNPKEIEAATAVVNMELNGTTSTAIEGNVTTEISGNTNVLGWTNGGLAAGIGGTATSTVNGSTTITINGDGKLDHSKDSTNEAAGDNDKLPQITDVLNWMEEKQVSAIGVTGGGAAVTTLGGTADAVVDGSTTINVNNATVIGLIGGGAAASVDATGVVDLIRGTADDTKKGSGNDNKTADLDGKQLEGLLGTKLPDAMKVTAADAIDGGTATSIVTGDTNISLKGTTTAIGVIGGGAAAASHTYAYKGDKTDWVNNEKPDNGYSENDEYGASRATATTGKSHITIALTGDEKTDDLLGGDLYGRGEALGVFGGGAAIAQSGHQQFTGNADGTLSKTDGAFATAETAGSEINVESGHVAGVFGGGIAAVVDNATATAAMTDTVDINIKGADVSGVVGGGLAYFTGTSNNGANHLKGIATAAAKDTNINVQSGTVAGILGGGMAIDDSEAATTNAVAKTDGTATINVNGGTVTKVDVSGLKDALTILDEKLKDLKIDTSGEQNDVIEYVGGITDAAGNAAIAAGGVALSGGAEADVANAVVNINGGEVQGDIYGGGIAAYGYSVTEEGENGQQVTKPVGGSHVGTSTINLNGGTVTGNVYAGGAASSKDKTNGSGDYTHATATVGTSTINLAGTTVDGILYGTGTVDGEVNKTNTNASATVGTSTLNLIGKNELGLAGETTSKSSKIQDFTNVVAKAGSETVVTDADANTALISGGKVTVEDGALLNIKDLPSGITAGGEGTDGNTYKIADKTADASTFWDDSDLIYDRMNGVYAKTEVTNGKDGDSDTSFSVKYEAITEKNANEAADSMTDALGVKDLRGMFREGMSDKWSKLDKNSGAGKYLDDWQMADNKTPYQKGMLFGEDAAVTGNTVSIARAMADNVTQRLSFTDDYVQEQGWANQDGGVWAKYMHRKYETDGMSSSVGGIHSSTDYDGVLVGMDLAKNGKFQSGVAIHYGSGEGDGLISHNDYDAWGITLYGGLKDEEAGTNLMADIGWMTSDNDIDGTVAGKRMSADRDVDAWTIGIRGEKEFVSGKNQIVPYAGLRYMSVNPGSYTTYYNGQAAFHNDAENQDLWLLPIGVSFRNETATSSGWKITPKLDLSYIWAFGDTDTDMTVNAGGYTGNLYYDVMDDSSWLATLGVEAEKDAWTFGINYGYQKGDDTKNKTWYVTAGYSF